MLQIALAWAVLGALIGAFATLAGARSAVPRGPHARAALVRWAWPPAAIALIAIIGGWLATLMVGRLAATAAALGLAAVAALLSALLPKRISSPGAAQTHDAPAP